MNDSNDTTPGAPQNPEDSTSTPTSNEAPSTEPTSNETGTPQAESSETRGADEQPTEAHTLPYITGTPHTGRLVNSTDQNHQAYDAAQSAGTPAGNGTAAYPTAVYGAAAYGATPANQGYSYLGQDGRVYTVQPGMPGAYPAAFAKPRRRAKPWMLVTGAAVAAVIIAGAAGGTAFAVGHSTGVAAAKSAAQSQQLQLPGSGSGSSGSGTFGFGGGSGSSSDGSSSGTGTSTQAAATAATDAEKKGLVTIVSTLDYDESTKSAGTGMIMTSSGRILTNNHVIQGATSIEVTDETTGKTYTADVVGTDATHDVAVLQLQDASGLSTVSFDTKTAVAKGDAVHSTGNAEGTGNLVTATGTVSAIDQSITVQSESGSGSESLSDLIEVDSDVVSGDSGGPLRNSAGDVVGIITAASSGSATVTGFAIPISSAIPIADDIIAGKSSTDIQIGLPAFLGAEIATTGTDTGSGVTLGGTVTGSAAAKAGLTAGDTITAIDGTATPDSTTLTDAITSHKVGDSVTVTYTDASGASQSVTVVLGSGPAA